MLNTSILLIQITSKCLSLGQLPNIFFSLHRSPLGTSWNFLVSLKNAHLISDQVRSSEASALRKPFLHTLLGGWVGRVSLYTPRASVSSCHGTWHITLVYEACPGPLPPGLGTFWRQDCAFCTASEQIIVTRLLNEGKTPSGSLRFRHVTDFFPSLILPDSQ